MKLFTQKLPAAMMLVAIMAPLGALADAPAVPPAATPAPAPAATPDTAERMRLMQSMRARMQEMKQTPDLVKRRALMEAQMKDMDALIAVSPPGSSMGMMMGPGMGGGMGQGPGPMAMGTGGPDNCPLGGGPGTGMTRGPGAHCAAHAGCAVDQRLDSLEKRIDMLQMMMQFMMRD